MNKNTERIKTGISALTYRPYEIISGTVVAGSVNTDAYTMSVRQSDGDTIIEGVMLNTTTGNSNGMILVPADNSDVIIGSIDGPGEWVLIRAGEITKAVITIANVKYEMNNTGVLIQNANMVFNMESGLFKINTPGESLYALLSDLITAITVMTVGTSTGPSTVPTNVSTFTTLLTRLGNLLSA